MDIKQLIIDSLAPTAIISFLHKQDPCSLAQQHADIFDEILDKQFKEKKSEYIQQHLTPFLDTYIKCFNQRLLEN